jgi:hypothetical protein
MWHTWGRRRSVYRFWLGGLLGRLRCRWENNIKMYLKEIEIYGTNWIQLAQDRVQWQAFVNMVMNLWVI